jgi:hypothetical protein
MNNVVFTVPLEPPRFLTYIFRTCLALVCIGSVIFTTVGFIKAERQIERNRTHGHAHRKHCSLTP